MNSLFSHIKSVRDIFFEFTYRGFINNVYITSSFFKLLIVFDLRNRISLVRTYKLKYFQRKNFEYFFVLFYDLYQNLFFNLISDFLIPLIETFSVSYSFCYRPYRNSYNMLYLIKNSFFSKRSLLNSVVSLNLVLFFNNSSLFSNFFFRHSLYCDNFPVKFFLNFTYYLYSFFFNGLLKSSHILLGNPVILFWASLFRILDLYKLLLLFYSFLSNFLFRN